MLELGKNTLEEIFAIPESIRRSLNNKEERDQIFQVAKAIIDKKCDTIVMLGSGTSYHAGLVATYSFNQLAKIPTFAELAPEFPYLLEPVVDSLFCVICISQSGESELTVYAAQKAKEKGSLVIGITNTKESALAKVADYTLYTRAGAEKSVLATKTYVTELVLLLALSIDMGYLSKKINEEQYDAMWDEMKSIPKLIELTLPMHRKEIRNIAPYFKFARQCFVIGAGPDYANCMEAALKLKEGARIFAQAYSTAEFPHGPITLAESGTSFVLCILPRIEAESRHADVIKLIRRLKERGVTILGIKDPSDIVEELDIVIDMPRCSEMFQPVFSIIPVQLLVVEIATIQGIDPDKPKFLSKVAQL